MGINYYGMIHECNNVVLSLGLMPRLLLCFGIDNNILIRNILLININMCTNSQNVYLIKLNKSVNNELTYK